EDDDAYAHLLAEHLREADCSVVTASTGDEALSVFRACSPAVVLLDVHLKGAMDGWDVLLALEREEGFCETSVFLTSLSDGRLTGLALDGATRLTRPRDPDEWKLGLKQALGDMTARRGLVVDGDAESRSKTAALVRVLGALDVACAKDAP